jgi:hypothetical protein
MIRAPGNYPVNVPRLRTSRPSRSPVAHL